jgi:hypothetical protein
LTDAPGTGDVEAINADGFASPTNTYGSAGDIAIVASTAKITYWEKVGVNWVVLGDTGSADFQFSRFAPTTQSDGTSALTIGNVYVRLTKQGGGVDLGVSIYDATSGLFTAVQAPFYSTDDLASVDLIDTADFTVEGVQFQPNASTLDALIIQMQSSSSLNTANVNVEKVGSNKIRFTKSDGKELNVVFASGFGALGFAVSDNSDSVWGDLSYEAKATQPTGTVADGTLWYNTDLKIEILKNTFDGTNMVWQRHAWSEDADGLLGIELQLRTGMPTTRKDGTSPLQAGDIWVDGDEMP